MYGDDHGSTCFSLELLICGMCSNPKVNEQSKARDLALSLAFAACVCAFVLQAEI